MITSNENGPEGACSLEAALRSRCVEACLRSATWDLPISRWNRKARSSAYRCSKEWVSPGCLGGAMTLATSSCLSTAEFRQSS